VINNPYIIAVTVKNVAPIINIFFLDPEYTIILNKNNNIHSEQGLSPSTKEIINVFKNKDLCSTLISLPNNFILFSLSLLETYSLLPGNFVVIDSIVSNGELQLISVA
jgi:hypothetical protein